jgi:hypothetical protein
VAKDYAMYRTPVDPAALGSPEGQATSADLANFASGGVDICIADTRDI